MRKIRISTAIAVMALLLTGSQTFAQRGQGQWGGNMPQEKQMMRNFDKPPQHGFGMQMLNLTEEQQEKITQLRTTHLNEVTPLRNELNEKRARLRTLQSVAKPNQKDMDKVIDEMASIRAKIQKKSTAHRVAVQALLTDEQRAVFNARTGNYGGKGAARGGRGHGCGGFGGW